MTLSLKLTRKIPHRVVANRVLVAGDSCGRPG
jgi:hypothetical protein